MIDLLDLKFASVDELYLDPQNPRVGRHNLGPDVSQANILEIVANWSLEELARSYLENGGFWQHEALLAVREELYGAPRLVVVEGNRRLAALRFLRDAYADKPSSRLWKNLAESATPTDTLFTRVPYLLLESREDIQAFLGFRHVTGIKQWDADEKAYFIAKMIDEQGMNYEQVMRMVGSNTPAVRRHYIAFRVLLQIENTVQDYDRARAEDSFAILYMTLDTLGARLFLNINIEEVPPVERPVPSTHQKNLEEFAKWLYGGNGWEPVIVDTRQASKFGKVLKSEEAIGYLRRTPQPNINRAYQLAGGEEEEVIRLLQKASDNIKEALSYVYEYKESEVVQAVVRRLGTDILALLSWFPGIRNKLLKDVGEEFD